MPLWLEELLAWVLAMALAAAVTWVGVWWSHLSGR